MPTSGEDWAPHLPAIAVADVTSIAAEPVSHPPWPTSQWTFIDFLDKLELPAARIGDVGGYVDGDKDYRQSVAEHETRLPLFIDRDWLNHARQRHLQGPDVQALASQLPQLFSHLNMDHTYRFLDPIVDDAGCREWVQSLVLRPMARLLQAYFWRDASLMAPNRHLREVWLKDSRLGRSLQETSDAGDGVDDDSCTLLESPYSPIRHGPIFELAPPTPPFHSTLSDARPLVLTRGPFDYAAVIEIVPQWDAFAHDNAIRTHVCEGEYRLHSTAADTI